MNWKKLVSLTLVVGFAVSASISVSLAKSSATPECPTLIVEDLPFALCVDPGADCGPYGLGECISTRKKCDCAY
jgi:hypothetical protein